MAIRNTTVTLAALAGLAITALPVAAANATPPGPQGPSKIGPNGPVKLTPQQQSSFAGKHPGVKITAGQQAAVDAKYGIPKNQTALDLIVNAIYTVDEKGSTTIFGGLYVDSPKNVLNVWVTDPSKASDLLNAAKKIDSRIDLSRVRIHQATYALKSLRAAGERLLDQSIANKLAFHIYAIHYANDGSHMQVDVPNVNAATRAVNQKMAALKGQSAADVASGVKIVFSKGVEVTPTLNRNNDSAPFIAGDNLFESGRGWCTAGIPVVGTTTGNEYIVTASHCFRSNTIVLTGGGRLVGTVIQSDRATDSEIIRTHSNGDEGEFDASSGGYYPLNNGVSYSGPGDWVCHDGYQSYANGHGVPCSIQAYWATNWPVTTADGATGKAYGLEGTINGVVPGTGTGYTSQEGDSGGLVFHYSSGGYRQVRGIISAGDCYVATGTCISVLWTQAPSIFNAHGLRLNTSQVT